MPHDTVPVRCGKCGGTEFSFTADSKPDDPVTCTGCDNVMRYEDFQAFGRKQVFDAVATKARKAFMGDDSE